ncbi:unnamed protein product [Arabis nemorensis]|uniref:RNase H type-1 domain-containing protein n=1 Tax=Arabis nemorensis TaxID=586526 RepID=A0A565B7R5_9BRAS|nr:unnamed protein product [Arabis nemorensis]
MGWIVKDSEGITKTTGSHRYCFVPSALVAEALDLKLALSAAHTNGISTIQVFSDPEILINTLRSGEVVNEIAGILHDVRGLVFLFSSISFYFISRSANLEADSLAKAALSNSHPFWGPSSLK